MTLKPEKWSQEDWVRFWMHLPIGVATGLFICLPLFRPDRTLVSLTTGILFALWFWIYEIFNEIGKKDKSYKDIIGGAFGFGAVAVISFAVWLLF